MTEGRYSTLLEHYRPYISDWTSESELWAQVRNAFIDEAERLLRELGQVQPPFDPVLGLHHRGVQEVKFILDLPEEARLNPTEKGFSLWIRRDPALQNSPNLSNNDFSPRLRTTLAHELAHTFFFDTEATPPRPFVSYISDSERKHAAKEEWWCMDFARAYLVPVFWVQSQLTRPTFPSLRVAAHLKLKLGVSWDLLFRRLVWDLRIWRNTVVFSVERSNFKITGVWKSSELRNWRFSKWYDLYGRSAVYVASKNSIGRERIQDISIENFNKFRLMSFGFPKSDLLLCCLSPNEDSSLDSFSTRDLHIAR